MDIVKTLLSSLGDNGLDEMARRAGVSKNQTASALEGAIPVLLGSMAKNASSREGANGLLGALDRDHDGSILDDALGFLQGGNSEGMGSGILKHILGGNETQVESSLANKVGINSSSMTSILKMAAPFLLGLLGKQRRSNANSGFDAGNIGNILSGLAGNADDSTGLDLGDIFNMVGALRGNGGSQAGGVGSLLKGLFG